LAWTSPKGGKEGGACLRFSQGRWRRTPAVTQRIWPRLRAVCPPGTVGQARRQGNSSKRQSASPPSSNRFGFASVPGRLPPGRTRSLLQLPFQQFDLFGQRGVGAHEVFDLAHGVQHGGVVTTAEAPPDLRQRT